MEWTKMPDLHHFLCMVFHCFNYLFPLCPLLQLFNCTQSEIWRHTLLTLKPITPNIWSSGVNGNLTNVSIAMQTFDSN